jgi:ribonuclease R
LCLRGIREYIHSMEENMEENLLKQRKEMLTKLVHDPAYVPMKAKEIASLLDIPKKNQEELSEVLSILVDEGAIGISKKGKYGKPELFSVTGIFTGHPKGFGFVAAEGMEQDIFIPAEKTGGALHGDRVRLTVEQESKGRRPEGAVLKVLEHANKEVIGYYQKSKNFGFVIPDNQKIGKDIFIPGGKDMGAVTGHKVVVQITDFSGKNSQNPEGVVTEIIGHTNDPGTDIVSLVRAYGLPEGFPKEVIEETKSIGDEVMQAEYEGRLDLRSLPTVTIDGEDSKDLDDAITLSKEGEHYRLGVHIADVTHYVKENSLLDQEARKRGTSVYLVDRVIPMLPHKLSNGICSLNEGTDRLALSCLMELDQKGNVLGHEIAETVIRVDRRMTYTAVNAILSHEDEERAKEYQDLVPMFRLMRELSERIREQRYQRGAIDFDFPESKILLDEKGKPISIQPYERNVATKLIEDFMLTANETIAEDFYWQQLPFLYRTHDNPDPEKIKQLTTFLYNFGYAIHTRQGEIHPKEIQKLLKKAEGTIEEPLIGRLTLRSMKQASYTIDCTGHFGLAAKYYCHFTSPIRRYPDLQIHRIIKENLKGGLSQKRIDHYNTILLQVAIQSSALERRAEEAERETDKLKKCEYMSRFIGQEFDGVISGVTGWGLYVELPNTVEGMVRISDLTDDYYIFDEASYQLVGEMTRKIYKLGQKVKVIVSGTDRLLKTIDFIFANHI